MQRYDCNAVDLQQLKRKQKQIMNIALVNTLAAQIRRYAGTNRSESMRAAWAIIKATPDAFLLRFYKKGETVITRRVVTTRRFDYTEPKGGAPKPNQVIYADLAKHAAGLRCTISALTQNIVA